MFLLVVFMDCFILQPLPHVLPHTLPRLSWGPGALPSFYGTLCQGTRRNYTESSYQSEHSLN